ncbi:MAG TPA: RidA family protein, partial [Micropepsaceae bacterium]|nr:RidA family protein [Micropepsaceae bacterium]
MRKSIRLPLAESWLAKGQEPIVATQIGNLLYTSGVPGIDLKTGQLPDNPERQFAVAFDNLMDLLQRAGAGP